MLLNVVQNNKKVALLALSGVITLVVAAFMYMTPKKTVHVETNLVTALAKANPTQTPTPLITVKPTKYPTPTTGTSLVQSKSSAQSTPTPTPAATQTNNSASLTPTPTNGITPSPTQTPQSGTTIKGSYMDGNGNHITLPNMKVKITNPDKGISQESTNSPYFEFTNLPPGSYMVEAQSIDGYSISHQVCFNCFESGDPYYNSASFGMQLTENHTSVGVTFKYIQ